MIDRGGLVVIDRRLVIAAALALAYWQRRRLLSPPPGHVVITYIRRGAECYRVTTRPDGTSTSERAPDEDCA